MRCDTGVRTCCITPGIKRHPYIWSVLVTAVVTAIAFSLTPLLHPANVDNLYLIAVLVVALAWGEGPAIFTAILGAVVFDYCFVPPRFTFVIGDLAYLVTLAGFLAVAVVTSRLAAHSRELIRAQSARERAEALSEAKDQVLHKVSHELRAPLTAVVGWAQMLRQVEMDGETFERALEGLENSTHVLRGLVNDLWDASRAASGKLPVKLKPIALAPCVSKALDVVVRAADAKGVQLQAEIDAPGDILGDELRIEQIVTNLVMNAIKFTPPGGLITVKLSRREANAELAVTDTGAGIAKEFIPYLFDPFSQGDPSHSRGGLGLGLSIVKYLVEAHGGTIAVASAGEQRGSTFTVRLPLIAEVIAAPAA